VARVIPCGRMWRLFACFGIFFTACDSDARQATLPAESVAADRVIPEPAPTRGNGGIRILQSVAAALTPTAPRAARWPLSADSVPIPAQRATSGNIVLPVSTARASGAPVYTLDSMDIARRLEVAPATSTTSMRISGPVASSSATAEIVSSRPDLTIYAESLARESDEPLARSGASALCRDGTLSYSEHRRGACSHHHGVARWLRALP
jgi:hypothetical protein